MRERERGVGGAVNNWNLGKMRDGERGTYEKETAWCVLSSVLNT